MHKRFPHYLRPLGRGKWPQAIICVDAVGVVQQTLDRTPTRIELLKQWNYQLLIRQGDTYTVKRGAAGITVNEWWRVLSAILNHTQHTWIVSYRACRLWALLGLWESLENGTALLVETPSEISLRQVRGCDSGSSASDSCTARRATSNVPRLLAQATGYLVAEDPPNIVRFRIANQARWVQWVDLRNYGVERPPDVDCGTSTVSWLAKSFQSIVFALHTSKMGGLRATAGAQALAGFRTGYYNGGIYCHNDKQSLAIESSAYYGGRCEVRHIGVCEGTITHLDFRSLYPSCCVNCSLPVRLVSFQQGQGRLDIATGDSGIGTIAEVDIETDEPAYPYRRINGTPTGGSKAIGDVATKPHSYDTDIIYPIGRFRTVLAGPELNDALGRGRVRRVHQLARYEMEYALRDYANEMHNMRSDAERNGEESIAQLAKMLSVCISGKFGQRLRIWEYEPNIGAHVPYGEWWGADTAGSSVRYRSIGWTVWRQRELGWSKEACPAIAAWITSAGRVQLLSAIRVADWENVFYYDTDSLFVNEVGYDKLSSTGWIADKTLGLLQYKGTADYASFNGIKDYTFGDSVRSAGTPAGYYCDAGDGQHFWYNTSPSVDIRKGRKPDGRNVLGRYYRDGEYRHGVVHDDGCVTPFVLEEW